MPTTRPLLTMPGEPGPAAGGRPGVAHGKALSGGRQQGGPPRVRAAARHGRAGVQARPPAQPQGDPRLGGVGRRVRPLTQQPI